MKIFICEDCNKILATVIEHSNLICYKEIRSTGKYEIRSCKESSSSYSCSECEGVNVKAIEVTADTYKEVLDEYSTNGVLPSMEELMEKIL